MTSEADWLTDREQQAWRGLVSLWSQLSAALARDMSEHSELSMADFTVLVALTDACGGRVRAFSLAESLQWERSRLSHQLARMEGRGLLRRDACSEDGRGQVVCVTAAGRSAIEAAAPAHVAAVRRLFLDALTPEQVEVLAAITRTGLERLADTARAPGSGG